ncbi:alpha-mannosidase [Paenibacillus thalictri]|uniref:alpha-mannosidase n=1 Tax=Paenibacillus thalictri TaxID=2527873 RepID=UPI0013EF5039|nr:alpha-mannosidase [Paenibacillus thalictri]
MDSMNPMMLTKKKLERRIEELEKYRYKQHVPIPQYEFWVDEQAEVGVMPPPEAIWNTIRIGDRWRGRDVTAWMRAEAVIPAEWAGLRTLGLFDFGKTNGGHTSGFESLLYVNGKPFQGVGGYHQEVFFPAELSGQKVQLLFKIWSGLNGNTGIRSDLEHEVKTSALAVLDVDCDDLYYTALAALHTLAVVEPSGYEYDRLLQALDRAFLLLDWREPGGAAFYASVSAACRKLHEQLRDIPKTGEVTVRCIGHTHIDVAWLWRLKHTREKSARSFSTVLRYMEQFPEYVFLQTQPHLYDDLQRDYPDIYAQIAERVKEGRWEAGGAMWLESDCNIPSGESLVRQLVYGQRFFEKHFGARCEYLWLPDVFGYSWALPQILKKAGLRYFMTTKISWNVYNRFPHDTFYWSGIDGTEILTHFITTPDPFRSPESIMKFYTYNGHVLPQTVKGIWRDYRDKEINNELLLSFGYGDGGGGPTRTMLEMRRRLEHMPGLPTVTTGRADEYFNKLEERVASTDRYVHRWDGELYLELHRGTYTSQAYNKKMNRHMENLLRNAEMASTFYGTVAGFSGYRQSALYDSWIIVLRNQFHDILPGSSIAEVYEDCHMEYAEAERLAQAPLRESLHGLAQSIDTGGEAGYLLFNALPWDREEVIELESVAAAGAGTVEDRVAAKSDNVAAEAAVIAGLDEAAGTTAAVGANEVEAANADAGAASDAPAGVAGKTDRQLVQVKVPALGYAFVSKDEIEAHQAESNGRVSAAQPVGPMAITESCATTPYYVLEWNETGQLTRLYDKVNDREVLAPGETANRFDVHEDKPAAHDAWDIDIFYYEKTRCIDDLKSVEVVEAGPLRGMVRFIWSYGRSEIRQLMTLYAADPRIDFVTEVSWHEPQQLLKVAFPVNVRSTTATYEIQYGNVERPTHWNTSWDFARFETCAQRWIDLSERDYGVSLLNDCKYGHDVIGRTMRITLIKAAISPDATADIGEHEFIYSLLPHAGDWFEAGTQRQAQRLNTPLVVCPVAASVHGEAVAAGGSAPGHGGAPAPRTAAASAGKAPLPRKLSFFGCKSNHVAVDAIKKAEDADAWIVRCYEYGGKRGSALFSSYAEMELVEEVNLMEREEEPVDADVHHFQAYFKPYELKTFRIRMKMT